MMLLLLWFPKSLMYCRSVIDGIYTWRFSPLYSCLINLFIRISCIFSYLDDWPTAHVDVVTSWWVSLLVDHRSLWTHVVNFFVRLQLNRSVVRASKCSMFKINNIVNLWVKLLHINFGVNLFYHSFVITFAIFYNILFGWGSLMRVQ